MFPESIRQAQAQGKLLLTGEYAVLDGALALAVPVRYGQTLRAVRTDTAGRLHWISLDENGAVWFEAELHCADLTPVSGSDPEIADTLRNILQACRDQNPGFLPDAGWGLEVVTRVDFPRAWGLGTSSTLIALLAQWAGADPYRVLSRTLGGSGYDIACAFAGGPILYRREQPTPMVKPVDFRPNFADRLYFVYLDQKQDSRAGIRRYRERAAAAPGLVTAVSKITESCLQAENLADFNGLLLEHEHLISAALGLPRAQTLYFPDFPGVVKSLGAWGGDFVLAAGTEPPEQVRNYFAEKGYSTCIPYREMVL